LQLLAGKLVLSTFGAVIFLIFTEVLLLGESFEAIIKINGL
jgi:hypothetical protein